MAFGIFAEVSSCAQMMVLVAAGFSPRRTGETPVPPRKLIKK
jgi:hypothetical protein